MAGEKKLSELLSRSVPAFPPVEDPFGLGVSFHSESPEEFGKRVWGTRLNKKGGLGFFPGSQAMESLVAFDSPEEAAKKKDDDFLDLLEESRQQALQEVASPTVVKSSPFAVFQKPVEAASAESSIEESSVPPTPNTSPFAAFSKTS